MLGSQLGRYRIEEQLGAGGMGVVYRAYDTRLQRDVALKILREGTVSDDSVKKRFRREALALSRLNHPNIATVHDFDSEANVDFLVMELIPGATLTPNRNGMPEAEVLRLGLQLAQGLAAAHSAGVLHRDLKPANVRVTPDGRLKILDFGLAQFQNPSSSTADTASAPVNAIVGTLPYMAPEQLQGGTIDERTDIYGAGAVLYELLTGSRPFPELNSARLMHAILHELPLPPTSINAAVSPGLQQVVLKAMDKNPERRYHSARELAVDLGRLIGTTESASARALPAPRRRLGIAALTLLVVSVTLMGLWLVQKPKKAPITTLAILPFTNISKNPDTEYLGDGIAETIINKLGQLSQLHVAPRSLSFRYKGESVNLELAARDLHSGAILTGSVLQRGDKILINTELLDAGTKERLWGAQYVRNFKDIFDLQDEIASEISNTLRVKLSPQDVANLKRRQTDDSEAYRLFLEGRYHFFQDKTSLVTISLFQRAIAKDPSYAPAYAGLADAYQLLWYVGGADSHRKGEQYARKALSLDPALADGHSALANNLAWTHHDWQAGEREFRRALDLEPGRGDTYEWYGWFLAVNRRFRDAEAVWRKGKSFEDPERPFGDAGLQFVYYLEGDCARGMSQADLVLRNGSSIEDQKGVAHDIKGRCYERIGRSAEALREYTESLNGISFSSEDKAVLERAFASGGLPAFWRKVLQLRLEKPRGRDMRAFERAGLELLSGNKTAALDWLEKSFAANEGPVAWINADPDFDSLRAEPRFQALLHKLNFR